MNKYTDQRGFGFIALILVIVVVAAIALIGMHLMGSQLKNPLASTIKTQTPVPAKISSTADLQTASQALSTTNVDNVNLTQLDSDLNSLL